MPAHSQCRVLSLRHRWGIRGLWCRTHHTMSSMNPPCPTSHLLWVPALLHFFPSLAFPKLCSSTCQLRASQSSPIPVKQVVPRDHKVLPVTFSALELQPAEVAPISPGERTLTPARCLPAAKWLQIQPEALWSCSVETEMEEEDSSPSLPAGKAGRRPCLTRLPFPR